MRTFKKISALLLAVVMTVTVFHISAAEALADPEYSLEVFYGYGKSPAPTTQHLTGIFDGGTVATGNDCSEKGVRDTAYNASSNSGNTFRYDRTNQTEISSVDFYYNGNGPYTLDSYQSAKGNQLIGSTSRNVYLTPSGTYSADSSGNTQAVQVRSNADSATSTLCMRWLDISGDVDVVVHYFAAHYVTINTGANNAVFSSSIPGYFFTTTANTATVETAGDYSNADGLSATVTPVAAPTSIIVSDGTNNATINGANLTGDVYVTSAYAISDTHDSSDVLRYNNGVYTFYNINSDININYAYTAATVDVTFMNEDTQYGSVVTIPQNTSVSAPATDPEKDGYVFLGWYEKDQYGDFAAQPFDFTTSISADLTLYAKYELVHTITFNNIKSISASAWAGATGGAVSSVTNRTATMTTAVDYAEAAAYDPASPGGVQAKTIVMGTLKSVRFEWTGGSYTATGDEIYGQLYFYDNNDVVHADAGVYSNDPFWFKYAYNAGDTGIWYRFRSLSKDLTITAEYENHTIAFLGTSSISASEWPGTGGTVETLGQMVSLGDYSSTDGIPVLVNASFGTPSALVFSWDGNEVEFDRSADSGKFLTKTGEKASSFSSGNTILKYALSSNKMYVRFYIVETDIDVLVRYSDLPDKITMEYVDDHSVTTQCNIDKKTINTRVNAENTQAVVPSGELGTGTTYGLAENRSVRFAIGVKDSMVEGIRLSKKDGTVIHDFLASDSSYTDPDKTYKFAYSDGADGKKMYFLRIGAVGEDVVVTPILSTTPSANPDVSMAAEVGDTLTALFYVDPDAATVAANYDSFVMSAQLGNGAAVDIAGTVDASGQITFRFEQIYAQCMTEKITGTVYGVKEGVRTAIEEITDGISIAEYCDLVAGAFSTNNKLLNFMANMLNYGSECQLYVDPNMDAADLARAGHDAWITGRITSTDPVSPIAPDELMVINDSYNRNSNGYIKSASLNITNKIAVVFKVYAPAGVANLRLEVNDVAQTLTPDASNNCRVQLDRIVSTEYDMVYTAKLYYNDTLVQTVKYSVNTYCARMFEKSSNVSFMTAIYNYGVAAESYIR